MMMHPTKINFIMPIIPEPTRNIMDFTFVVAGASLNMLLGLVIVLKPRMHTSANCYIMSLVFSNLLILVEPLERTIDWVLGIKLMLDLDYVFLVSFSTSIVTIVLLNVETYIVVCQKSSRLYERMLRISTAVKGVLCLWLICVTITVMELYMYLHFEEEVMYDIYQASTIMFLVFPCFIFVMLDSFILYDLIISKLINDTWPSGDAERFVSLIGITVGYILTMIPYRVARAIHIITESCCSDTAMEILYTILKSYPLILPITCFVMSKGFRRANKEKRQPVNKMELSTQGTPSISKKI